MEIITKKTVEIPMNLPGVLSIPKGAEALVILRDEAHADILNHEGFGTLSFDLLSNDERADDMMQRELRFNIPLLSERLQVATRWIQEQVELPMCYLAASTRAAATIQAATENPDIQSIVLLGARCDLAGSSLGQLKVPTLLLVDASDHGVIEINQRAFEEMQCEKKLEIIDASHALSNAASWFKSFL